MMAMNGYCRLCGKEKENLSNIFYSGGAETVKIAIKIQKVLSIDVHKDDRLPITICNICGNELERTAEFIERTHQAQKHLKQLLKISIATESYNGPSPDTSQTFTNDSLFNEPKLEKIDFASADYKNRLLLENNVESEDYGVFMPVLVVLEPSDSEFKQCFDTKNSSVLCTNKRAKTESSSDGIIKYSRSDRKSVDKSIPGVESNKLNLGKDICETNQNNLNNDEDYDNNRSHDFAPNYGFDAVVSTAEESKANSTDSINKQSISSYTDASQPENEGKIRKSPIKKRSNLYYCDVCEMRVHFDRYDDFEKHNMAIHSKNSSFECKLCDSVFLKRKDFNAHMKTIHKKNIKCPLCNFTCDRKSALTLHKYNIHKELVACSQCDFRTDTQRKLYQHNRNKHTVSNQSFICEICGSTFKKRIALLNHRSYKHFPVPKQCPRCGIICPHAVAYSTHKLNCLDHRRYYCDSCGSSFFAKYRLREHMNKHLDIRPYECTMCAKTFFQRHRLEIHMSVHRGPRFQCDICGRSFNRKDNMRSHRKKQHPPQVAQE